jgi:hypothetical protein
MSDCIKNNTDSIIEPPACSDNIQANDRGINGAFKGGMSRKKRSKSQTASAFRESFTRDVIDELAYALLPRTVRSAYRRAGIYPLTPWAPLGNCVSVFTAAGAAELKKPMQRQADNYISDKLIARADENYSMGDRHEKYNRSEIEKFLSVFF